MAILAAAPMEGVFLCSAPAQFEVVAVIALRLGRKTIARDVMAMSQVQCSVCSTSREKLSKDAFCALVAPDLRHGVF